MTRWLPMLAAVGLSLRSLLVKIAVKVGAL